VTNVIPDQGRMSLGTLKDKDSIIEWSWLLLSMTGALSIVLKRFKVSTYQTKQTSRTFPGHI